MLQHHGGAKKEESERVGTGLWVVRPTHEGAFWPCHSHDLWIHSYIQAEPAGIHSYIKGELALQPQLLDLWKRIIRAFGDLNLVPGRGRVLVSDSTVQANFEV